MRHTPHPSCLVPISPLSPPQCLAPLSPPTNNAPRHLNPRKSVRTELSRKLSYIGSARWVCSFICGTPPPPPSVSGAAIAPLSKRPRSTHTSIQCESYAASARWVCSHICDNPPFARYVAEYCRYVAITAVRVLSDLTLPALHGADKVAPSTCAPPAPLPPSFTHAAAKEAR